MIFFFLCCSSAFNIWTGITYHRLAHVFTQTTLQVPIYSPTLCWQKTFWRKQCCCLDCAYWQCFVLFVFLQSRGCSCTAYKSFDYGQNNLDKVKVKQPCFHYMTLIPRFEEALQEMCVYWLIYRSASAPKVRYRSDHGSDSHFPYAAHQHIMTYYTSES